MTAPLLPPPPRPSVRQELYSVVMSNVSVQDLLFALARDAKLNVDIHPSISGTVTMNVRDQTMTEILDRVARQVDLRYEFNGKDLSIQPDTPFLRHYRVDYPNLQRDTETVVNTSTNLASTGSGGASAGGGNGATARRSTFREAASVIANPETGNISVRATQSQHARVREFLDRVLLSARRQVLIEATIVEVDLSSRFQQGIDWSLLRTAGSSAGTGITLRPAGGSAGLLTGGLVSSIATLSLSRTGIFGGNTDLTGMLSLLESFGTLRVLSSPKVSVLNNQSSVLKVVDNKVFFTITVTPGTPASLGVPAGEATYTSTINTVPIGFLMTVVPQISESNEVMLNLRPTISRITGYANDPNPVLAQNGLTNRIPEVQTREMESVLRVQSGDIAILGGLMQDSRNNNADEVPGLGRLGAFGNLFRYRDDSNTKSELVIFLRPRVLQDASLDGDLRDFRGLLPAAAGAMRSDDGMEKAKTSTITIRP